MKNGISDGTNMEANITREQLATILFRYVVYKGLDLVTLEDNLRASPTAMRSAATRFPR